MSRGTGAELLWAGEADHLDVLGHFADDADDGKKLGHSRHRDWITSGARFSLMHFNALLDALATFQLGA